MSVGVRSVLISEGGLLAKSTPATPPTHIVSIVVMLILQKGMQQEYFLGEVLKTRYVDDMKLLHPNYTRAQVLNQGV